MNQPEQQDPIEPAVLFLMHAQGYTTDRALRERRTLILNAIKKGILKPSEEVCDELAWINHELGED